MKNILIVTQTVDSNDPILGFFVGWIREFAKHCPKVHVLTLNVGIHDLPDNVTVHCLGKSEGKPKIVWLWRLWHNSITLRKQYDNVFVHMNPIHVIYAGIIWRLLRKRIGLWYTHPKVDLKLRIAHKFTNIVFTGSNSSFKISSKKKNVLGQGVDTNYFTLKEDKFNQNDIKLIVVGRLSRIKNVTLAIDVLNLLKDKYSNLRLFIVGGPVSDQDKEYEKYLKSYANEKKLGKYITWTGPLSQPEMKLVLSSADIFIHTSNTQSADKTLPEAMATGLFVVTSNQAYREDVPALSFQSSDPVSYCSSIESFIDMREREKSIMIQTSRELVLKKHSLARLIKLILELY